MIKKAELSINMIVVIVLALLCLIIIVYIFYNTSDGFREGTDCVSAGGRCVPDGTTCTEITRASCGPDYICCRPGSVPFDIGRS